MIAAVVEQPHELRIVIAEDELHCAQQLIGRVDELLEGKLLSCRAHDVLAIHDEPV